MAETLARSGSASSAGGSINTEVSTSPCRRRCSGTWAGVLVDQFVHILSKPHSIDRRSPDESGQEELGWYGLPTSHWHELPDRHAIPGDDVGLASVQAPHYLTAIVPERSLRDYLRHQGIVARVRHGSLGASDSEHGPSQLDPARVTETTVHAKSARFPWRGPSPVHLATG